MINHHSIFITYVLIIQTISMVFVIFPAGSILAWQRLKKKWKAQESKLLLQRRIRAKKKMQKYWEIEMPKFKR